MADMKTLFLAILLAAGLAGCAANAPSEGGCYPGASVQCRGLNTG